MTTPAGRALLPVPFLAIMLSSCGADTAQEANAAANKPPGDQFELVDRAGKTHVLADLHSCALTDKTTGDQRCDYRLLYLLSGGVHYRFDWDSIRSIERHDKERGDVFRLTLEGGQSVVGTFDLPTSEGKDPRPVSPADSLSAILVEMNGNTAIFPGSVIASLHRRTK
jgi:hypothetical protein